MSTEQIDNQQVEDVSAEDKGTKRPCEDAEAPSPNEWENADLGDGDRKQKFMRLMGSKGEVGSGDQEKHDRKEEETKKIADDLEEQFSEGLQNKLSGATKKHSGLGFQEEEEKKPAEEEKSEEEPKEAEETENGEKSEDGEESDDKKEDGEEDQAPSDESEEKKDSGAEDCEDNDQEKA